MKDFIPLDSWKNKENNNTITLKINNKLNSVEYTDIKIVLNENNDFVISTKLINSKEYIDRDTLIKRIYDIFPNYKIDIKNINEKEITGMFFYPLQRMHTYIFSDLVMNDDIFSKMIDMDESIKATKRKSNNQNWLYIHFNHINTGNISASIIQKFYDKTDKEINMFKVLFENEGDPYIRIRLKGENLKSINIFKSIFSKLLTLYDEKYNDIADFYSEYIPNFNIVEEKKIIQRKSKISDSIVFPKNYSRFCPVDRIPTIINEEDVNEYKNQGKQVMKFPRDRDNENIEIFSSDGIEQKYYICKNENYPYPGIQKNNLSNSEDYPYLPCCFAVNQEAKKTSNYRKYYYGENIEVIEKKQQELIITNKILNYEQYGILNDTLDSFFNLLEVDPNYRYIRVGVNRTYSSFLECLLLAFDTDGKISKLNNEDKIKLLKQKRIEISNSDDIYLAKQGCFDKDIDDIMEDLKNHDIYLDPKLYCQVLESFFNCKIYLFDTEKMIKPRYVQNYLEYKSNNPVILIYEHMGGESDRAQYPQCELIIKWNINQKSGTQFLFDMNNEIIKKIENAFNLLTLSFSLNKKNEKLENPFENDDISYISQNIDNYGKVRYLNVKYKDTFITFFTEPLPPLQLKETNEIYYCNVETAIKFIKSINSKEEYQICYNNKILELGFFKNKLSFNICINNKENRIKELKVDNSLRKYINIDAKSKINIYNKNKKYARYISENILWLFSNYIKDQNIDIIEDKHFYDFQIKNLIIKPNYKYKNISKIFSKNSNIFENGKLIITSEEMLKRLLYTLKLFSKRNLKLLKNYYIKTNIINYYIDISDFDVYPIQFLFQGHDCIDKIIHNTEYHKLYSEIQIGSKNPYFFQNDLISSKKVFLAQNVRNINDAFEVYYNWKYKKYNIGFFPEEKKDNIKSFTLYGYSNDKKIKKHNFGKKDNDIKIIGYIINEISYFTVLLEL